MVPAKEPKGGRAAGGSPAEGRPGAKPDGELAEEQAAPVIRDRRKVDPDTGQVRSPSEMDLDSDVETALEDQVVAAAELITARAEIESRTADLQRVAAEYANYRKRVDRDRDLAGLAGQADVLVALIPVLDDLEAARAAGELEGPFGAVASKLEAALAKFGLERYGAEGEGFDPAIHDALMHQTSSTVDGPTVTMVIQPGYRMGERILRAARVGVTDLEG
ncbi:MAG: nucleotide exchange factor GrpE [Micrococcales bacterium]|nr:nucleotide exchange factor GrpE [Micrococcales bacterium]